MLLLPTEWYEFDDQVSFKGQKGHQPVWWDRKIISIFRVGEKDLRDETVHYLTK